MYNLQNWGGGSDRGGGAALDLASGPRSAMPVCRRFDQAASCAALVGIDDLRDM